MELTQGERWRLAGEVCFPAEEEVIVYVRKVIRLNADARG